MNGRNTKKHAIAVVGSWLPVALSFLRSKACAELSPHGAKLLLDALALLGPNAKNNGDISLTPQRLFCRGWTSCSTLRAAMLELVNAGLLVETRKGSRLDCSLFALTLYPLDCDLKKLDVRHGCYLTSDWMGKNGMHEPPPTLEKPALWRRARKIEVVASPRDANTKFNEKTSHSGTTCEA